VNTPCSYAKIGEITAILDKLLSLDEGMTTRFGIHPDSAPTVHINGNPGQFDPTTFKLAVAMSQLTAASPIDGKLDQLAAAFADRTVMKLLHMVTQRDITTTWLGMAGPGVRHVGVTRDVFSDHTDIRPTLMGLVGLRDDYVHDGISLFAFTSSDRGRGELARLYKELNAPLGSFGLAAVNLITRAIAKGDPVGYAQTAHQIEALTAERDRIVTALLAALNDRSSRDRGNNELNTAIDDARHLLDRVDEGFASSDDRQ